MAKSKNHTNHNQHKKNHRNGIKKAVKQRYSPLDGVSFPSLEVIILCSINIFSVILDLALLNRSFLDGPQVPAQPALCQEAQQGCCEGSR